MGQGGYIALTNGTKYDWKRTYQHKYQMNSWNFPDIVPAGKNSCVYVEWNESIFHSKSDDAGEASYTLGDTGLSFQVQARAQTGFSLRVEFTGNLETPGNPVGSILNLGWVHDGYVAFILAGEKGKFTSTNLPSKSWMHDNLNVLGEKSLMHLCMPGSHDSGMNTFGAHTLFGRQRNTQTQTRTILGQLQLGARYIDIRPVISGGKYFTGHYSYIRHMNSWQGANGQSIPSIIQEINDFNATNKELVILDFSHDHNTDVGNSHYRPFNQAEWDSLLEMLKGLNNLFVTQNPSTIDLTKQKLSTFIGNNKAAVLIVIRPSNSTTQLGPYASQGFYLSRNLPVYNKFTGTNEKHRMVEDQLNKLQDQRPNPDACYFLLSWTLTQSALQATFCTTSILKLANKANPQMYATLFSRCSSQCYPNILYVDNLCNSNITALAMAISVCF